MAQADKTDEAACLLPPLVQPATTKKGLPRRRVAHIPREQKTLLEQDDTWFGSTCLDPLDLAAFPGAVPAGLLEGVLKGDIPGLALLPLEPAPPKPASVKNTTKPAPQKSPAKRAPKNTEEPASSNVSSPKAKSPAAHTDQSSSLSPSQQLLEDVDSEHSEPESPLRSRPRGRSLNGDSQSVTDANSQSFVGKYAPRPAHAESLHRPSSPVTELEVYIPGALKDTAAQSKQSEQRHVHREPRRSTLLRETAQRSANRTDRPSPPIPRRRRMKEPVFPDLGKNRRATLPASYKEVVQEHHRPRETPASRARPTVRVSDPAMRSWPRSPSWPRVPAERSLVVSRVDVPEPTSVNTSMVSQVPKTAYTWQLPYEAYQLAYPDFPGGLSHFLAACYCVRQYVNKGMLASFACDDVIRAYVDFIRYVQTVTSGKPMNLLQWYNRNTAECVYTKKVITSDNVAAAVAAYPNHSIQQMTSSGRDFETARHRPSAARHESVTAAASPSVRNDLMERVAREELSPPPPALGFLNDSASSGDNMWQHGQLRDAHLDAVSFGIDFLAGDSSQSQAEQHVQPRQPEQPEQHQEEPVIFSQDFASLEAADSPLDVPSSPVPTLAVPQGMDKIRYMLQSPEKRAQAEATAQKPKTAVAPVSVLQAPGQAANQKRRRQGSDVAEPSSKRRAVEASQSTHAAEESDEFEPSRVVAKPGKVEPSQVAKSGREAEHREAVRAGKQVERPREAANSESEVEEIGPPREVTRLSRTVEPPQEVARLNKTVEPPWEVARPDKVVEPPRNKTVEPRAKAAPRPVPVPVPTPTPAPSAKRRVLVAPANLQGEERRKRLAENLRRQTECALAAERGARRRLRGTSSRF